MKLITDVTWSVEGIYAFIQPAHEARRARVLRALGLLLADGTPTGGRGEDFLSRQPDFFTETAVTPDRKSKNRFQGGKLTVM